MEIEEIKQKIEKVEREIFMNEMNDHWSRDDYEYDDKKKAELKALQDALDAAMVG